MLGVALCTLGATGTTCHSATRLKDMTTTIGLIAAFCTTLAFLPQVIKIWKTKSAGDLSLVTFTVFTFGVALWLVYGVLTDDLPVILANIVTLILQGALLTQMIRYRDRTPKEG